jgi:hypothetical protein
MKKYMKIENLRIRIFGFLQIFSASHANSFSLIVHNCIPLFIIHHLVLLDLRLMILSPHFDVENSVIGGALIAIASIIFYSMLGRIMGVSSVLSDALFFGSSWGNRYIFIGTMLLGAYGCTYGKDHSFHHHYLIVINFFQFVGFGSLNGMQPFGSARPKELSLAAVIVAGLLVGFGTKVRGRHETELIS